MKLLTVARGLAVFGGLSKAVALLNENSSFETVDDVPIEADSWVFEVVTANETMSRIKSSRNITFLICIIFIP
jgi:hypothetical protein